ncbi:MAG: hypothetical protein IPL65_20395, partial [Lewinellaceae bacterium]|nr:hypothetical protein [Lewinellaceae bacterium]
MRKLFTPLLVLLFLISFKHLSFSQCNTTPCIIPTPEVNAMDACVLPNPASLFCYYGSTVPDNLLVSPLFWCTVINNNQWFAFTADAAT